MLNKLQNVDITLIEFFIKLPIVMFFIMPGCIGGFFWIGCQIDSMLNINVSKLILPGAGSILGIYLTGLLVLFGHAKRDRRSETTVANPQSSHA